MKYMILIYGNPELRRMFEQIPQEERAAGLAVYDRLREDLQESGEYIVSEALADPGTGRRVAVRDGALVSDGPFAEAKEHLAGFYLVDCPTMDRAVEYAARLPEAGLGMVEVRPVRQLSEFLDL
jgi:hypothetical protein